jgi:4-hydroxy-3-methylbut-2-en-1-yl diphosphate reductase
MTDQLTKRGLTFQQDDSIEITIAPNAGACFGVVRAIKLGNQSVNKQREGQPVYSFGPLIHNPKVVADLESRGVQTENDPNVITSGTVLLRSHGVQREIEAEFKARGLKLVDATCPLVKKPQRIAQSLGQKGYFLVVVGDENHPEVKGVLSYFGKDEFLVTYDAKDVDVISADVQKVGVLAQTTIEVKVLNQVVDRLKERFQEVSVYNTICDATSIRQSEAIELAKVSDVMVIVGGKNSSNTCKLVKICKDLLENTHHIEELSEIDSQWFTDKHKIGVTGGASTPHDFVDLVGNHIADLVLCLARYHLL